MNLRSMFRNVSLGKFWLSTQNSKWRELEDHLPSCICMTSRNARRLGTSFVSVMLESNANWVTMLISLGINLLKEMQQTRHYKEDSKKLVHSASSNSMLAQCRWVEELKWRRWKCVKWLQFGSFLGKFEFILAKTLERLGTAINLKTMFVVF